MASDQEFDYTTVAIVTLTNCNACLNLSVCVRKQSSDQEFDCMTVAIVTLTNCNACLNLSVCVRKQSARLWHV